MYFEYTDEMGRELEVRPDPVVIVLDEHGVRFTETRQLPVAAYKDRFLVYDFDEAGLAVVPRAEWAGASNE
jgi:hypothetical protein